MAMTPTNRLRGAAQFCIDLIKARVVRMRPYAPILLILYRVWLVAGVPKMYLLAPYDDLYFAKMAHYLMHGEWMGPYSQFTLIKAPFYGFFLALSGLAGLPLLITETLLYAFGCLVLYQAVAPLVRGGWWRLALFALVLFSPAALVTYWTLRVYREFVYASLTLLVIACASGLFLRLETRLSQAALWAFALSAAMGAFMLCREEGVWIYPALGLLLTACVLSIWRGGASRKWLRTTIVLLPIFIWQLPSLAVSYLNYSHYGFWGYSENMDADFNRVLNTIGRINTGVSFPFNAITRQSFERAYAVAPLLRALSPYIDARWDGWQQAADGVQGTMPRWYIEHFYPAGTNPINSHAIYMLRDALANAGYFSGGGFPRDYLRRMGDQLERACASGKLDCRPGVNLPLVGSMRAQQIPIAVYFIGDALSQLARLDVSTSNITALDLQNWPAEQGEFRYFDEVVYNPIGTAYFGVPVSKRPRVGGTSDFRFTLLDAKLAIMRVIESSYRVLNLVGFLVFLPLGLVQLIRALFGRSRIFDWQRLVVLLFVLALLLSRMLVLVIVSINTGFNATVYGASHYMYVHLLLFLTVFYASGGLISAIRQRREQAAIPGGAG